ncbi:hypothetical protein SAMN05216517_106123 [Janthinobacterium sp. OK676]|nr:hypothetical protein SAMN05216517_106123 [Janthinobacterium sp. OK676]
MSVAIANPMPSMCGASLTRGASRRASAVTGVLGKSPEPRICRAIRCVAIARRTAGSCRPPRSTTSSRTRATRSSFGIQKTGSHSASHATAGKRRPRTGGMAGAGEKSHGILQKTVLIVTFFRARYFRRGGYPWDVKLSQARCVRSMETQGVGQSTRTNFDRLPKLQIARAISKARQKKSGPVSAPNWPRIK